MLLAGGAPVLQVHPTRHCNLACEHCYTSSGPRERGELPFALLARALEDAASLGYRQVAVSGGEPLLYGGLRDLLAHGKSLGMLATVTTNGMLATVDRWDAVAPYVDLVAISIDGTEAEHDRIRGQRGAFAKTLANLDTIRTSGTPFGFIFTLTQHNVDSLEYVVRLAAAEGARSLQVHPLTLHGRAVERMDGARPDELELLAAIAEVQRLGSSLSVAVHVDALLRDQVVAYRDQLVPARPVRDVLAIAPVLVIESDARVMPLTHELAPAFALGCLHDKRLATLVAEWLASGRGDRLATVCDRTWSDLATSVEASYWYDEVAARSRLQLAAW